MAVAAYAAGKRRFPPSDKGLFPRSARWVAREFDNFGTTKLNQAHDKTASRVSLMRVAAVRLVLLVAGLVIRADNCAAQASRMHEIFAPPGGMWILQGAGFGTHGQYYGPSSPDADWVVSQWNTPQDLPPFHGSDTGNDFLHVHLGPDHSYVLEQNGDKLSCDRTYESGVREVHEFDLFVSPNNANRPEYKQAVLETDTNLGSMHHLEHKITLQPLLVQALDTECKLTRVTFVTSVTLTNPIARETLFYQLRLGMLQARGGVMENGLTAPGWFARGLDRRTGHRGYYGFDDSITSFGERPAEVGVSESYAMDLLPRLVAILHAGEPDGLDQELSHWRLRGTYHGEVIWGHMHVRSKWQGFSLAFD